MTTGISDASQKAAIDAAIRCIRFNERPRQGEREVLVQQLEFVKARITRAEEAKRVASQRERQADVGEVYRQERSRR